MGKDNNALLIGGGIALIAILAAGSSKTSSSSVPSPTSSKDIRLPFDGKLTTYVRLGYPYALEAHKQYPKIPVNLILTQSGLESGFGKAAPGNNFLGIKAGKSWKGDRQLLRTTEVLPKGSGYSFPEVISITKLPSGKYRWVVRDWFRKYPTPLGCYLDYCKLLYTPRYAKALAKSPDLNAMIAGIDWLEYVEEINPSMAGIKEAGYATDPNYVPKVQKLALLVNDALRNVA